MNKQTTKRKKTRKLLFQQLFSSTFQTLEKENFLESFFYDKFSFEIDKEYLEEMSKIIFFREEFFIETIKKYSPKFDFEKMNVLNIIPLYISMSEIFYFSEEIPLKVSINEAVDLAKTFSGDSSKRIVNGVLNSIMKDYEELEKIKNNYSGNNGFSIFKKS